MSKSRPRTYGFRLSATDVCVLIVTLAAAILLWPVDALLAGLPLMVVGHFFLFCNVIRLHRNLELTWGAIFVANCAIWWWWRADPRWTPVLAIQIPVTLLLVAIWMRNPAYHGIGARQINPRLDEYLHPRESAGTDSGP